MANLLRDGDDVLAELLLAGRGQPAFHPFLARGVSGETLRAISADLLKHPADPGGRLRVLQAKLELGDDILRAALEVRPRAGVVEYLPGYSVYRVYQAASDGDEVSMTEAMFAVADLATVVMPVGKVGVTVAKAGGKAIGKEAAREVVTTAARAAAGRRLKERAAKVSGEVVLNKATVWTAAGDLYRSSARVVRSVLTDHPKEVLLYQRAVDITGPVRFAHRHAGLGRDAFRRWTGLDARLFMRADARVALKLHWKVEGRAARKWIADALFDRVERYVSHGESVPPDEWSRLAVSLPAQDNLARAVGSIWLAIGLLSTTCPSEQ